MAGEAAHVTRCVTSLGATLHMGAGRRERVPITSFSSFSLSLCSTVMFLYFLLHRVTYMCKYVERMTRHILHIILYIIALPVM